MPTSDCATKATATPTSIDGATRCSELSKACSDVFVYFKHEDEGKGAAFGQQMIEYLMKKEEEQERTSEQEEGL